MTGVVQRNESGASVVLVAPLVLSLALFYLSMFVPPAGMFAPAPLFFSLAAHGFKIGMVSIAAATAAVFIIGGAGQAVLYLVSCGLMALALNEAYRRKASLEVTLAGGALAPYAAGVIVFVMIGALGGIGPVEAMTRWATLAIGAVVDSYQSAGADAEMIAWLKQNSDQMVKTFVRLLPGLSLVSALLMAAMNYLAIRALSGRFGWGLDFPSHTFANWRSPEPLLWVVIVSGFSVAVFDGPLNTAGWNLLIISAAAYLAHGVAIIHYFFEKIRVAPILRALGYFLFFSQPLIMLLICAAGFVDVWADFRKLRRPPDEEQ